MINKERKSELIGLTAATTITIKRFCKGDEELEFVIDTMAKAEGYASTIEVIRNKCMEVLKETLFGEKENEE